MFHVIGHTLNAFYIFNDLTSIRSPVHRTIHISTIHYRIRMRPTQMLDVYALCVSFQMNFNKFWDTVDFNANEIFFFFMSQTLYSLLKLIFTKLTLLLYLSVVMLYILSISVIFFSFSQFEACFCPSRKAKALRIAK